MKVCLPFLSGFGVFSAVSASLSAALRHGGRGVKAWGRGGVGVLGIGLGLLGGVRAGAQGVPTVQGVAVADAAVPVAIAPAQYGPAYYVLNQDLSVLIRSTNISSYTRNCAAPSALNAAVGSPRAILNDSQDLYVVGQGATGANEALVAEMVGSSVCTSVAGPSIPGGVPAQVLVSNDTNQGRLYVVSAFNGNSPDTITVVGNLNSYSGSGALLQQVRTALDSGGVYTSVVTDVKSTYSLTAITELKTATSPGNLWVYSPGVQTAFKILGPGGVALPAVTSFIIPAVTNGGGGLLVLVNQDGLTASNIFSPPADTTPFTIIDLGQLQQTFNGVVANGNTVTLPYVTQIQATASFYAMLGAAYNPVDRKIYAVVGGGSGTTSVVKSVIRYDPYSPSAPGETVVADLANVPLTFGAYPQIALNAASGTMQILTSSPVGLYSVGINGTGNTAVAVTGSVFPDAGFAPTYIAANPLVGETYIASSSGQVDVLTRPAASQERATLTLIGDDTAVVGSSYFLRGLALYGTGDASLIGSTVTITATPKGGTAYTFGTKTVGSFAYPGGNFSSASFAAAGVHALVASVAASATHPAFTSNGLNVTVVASGLAGVYPTTLTLTVPANSTATTFNASVVLGGGTYGPGGRIVINDATGSEVGRKVLGTGAITVPVVIPVTLPVGSATLTAVYNGDDQNAPSTSAPQTVVVGTVVKSTPALALTIPSGGTAGATLTGNILFNTTSNSAPTGSIVITALASGSTTPVTLATVNAAAAYASGGTMFTFTAPAAGSYTASANYAGDGNYNAAPPSSPSFAIGAAVLSTTTTNLSAATNQVAGVAFTLTVRLTQQSNSTGTPTGNVVVTATPSAGGAATTLATVTAAQALASGGFAAQVTLPSAGAYTVTATYASDANFSTSTGSLVITAGPVATTLVIAAPSVVGAGRTFTANLMLKTATAQTATPSGKLNLIATPVGGGTAIALDSVLTSVAYSPNGAALLVSLIDPGNYTLSATFTADVNFQGATATTGVSVLPLETFTVTGPTSVPVGTAFTVNINLKSQINTTPPTGNITLNVVQGTNTLPVQTIPAAQAFAAGGANLAVKITTVGAYTITATYGGDTLYGVATSTLNGATTAAPTQLVLSGPAAGNNSTPYTVNVLLKGTQSLNTVNSVISATLNGVVVKGFALGHDSTLGTGVSVALRLPTVGTWTINAAYPGDGFDDMPSTAAPLQVSIVAAATYMTVSAPATVVAGTPFNTTTKIVTAITASPTAFLVIEGYNQTAINNQQYANEKAPDMNTAAGHVSTGTLLTAGSVVLTSTYPGDANYPALYGTTTLTVDRASSGITVNAGTTAIINQPYQVVFQLGSTNGSPSGDVTVSAQLNGSTAAPVTQVIAANVALKQQTVFLTLPTAGTYTLTLSYPGDTNNKAITTAPISVVATVPPPTNFTLVLQEPAIANQDTAITAGLTPSESSLLLTASGTGPGPVTLSVAGLPAGDFIIFRDTNTRKLITTATPVAAGTRVVMQVGKGTVPVASLDLRGLRGGVAVSLAGLLGFAFIGWRKGTNRLRRTLYLLGAVLVIAASGTALSGCNDTYAQVVITATPVTANAAAPPQSVSIWVVNVN